MEARLTQERSHRNYKRPRSLSSGEPVTVGGASHLVKGSCCSACGTLASVVVRKMAEHKRLQGDAGGGGRAQLWLYTP